MELLSDLLRFHSPGNRYNYYPPASSWNGRVSESMEWESPILPLYLHLPFCRSLCTFCGCNIKVSNEKSDHLQYVESLIKELDFKLEIYFKDRPLPKEVSLTFGGGSPNFLHSEAREVLFDHLKKIFGNFKSLNCELDPRLPLEEAFLEEIKSFGPLMLSCGIQDFNNEVTDNVNRHRDWEVVLKNLFAFKKVGTLGIDLIWGLPLQRNLENWSKKLLEINPDTISFYPLAPVPWLKSYQEAYGDFTLPELDEKFKLFCEGDEIFKSLNYQHIGFGHYLKRESDHYNGWLEKSLHRTVSGLYLFDHTQTLGLGVSAISEGVSTLYQNPKIYDQYIYSINRAKQSTDLKFEKYHIKTKREIEFSQIILDVCKKRRISTKYTSIAEELPKEWFSPRMSAEYPLEITERGLYFLKNILQFIEKSLV